MAEKYSLNETYIRRVFQLSGSLLVENSPYGTAKYNATIIYNWLTSKFNSLKLPEKIRTISRERAGQSVNVIYDYKKQYFCMLAQHPDYNVAGRMWLTEAEIFIHDNEVRFGVKLSYSSPVGTDAGDPGFSIPRFVRDIALKDGIVDCWRFKKNATYINSDGDLIHLLQLLQNKERQCPVIVVAECENESTKRNPFKKGYLIDPDQLADKLFLTAHVVALPVQFQEQFTDKVGENFNVYDGAVRTYYPGLDLEEDDYKRHPFTIPPVILASSYTDDNGKDHIMGDAYQYVLEDRIHQYIGRARINWNNRGHKFYYVANRELLKLRISNTNDIDALREEFRRQEKKYEDEINSAEDAAYSAIEDTTKVQNQLDEARDTIHKLQAKIDALKCQLENAQGQEAITIPIPDTYDKLPDWVDTYFPGRLKLHPRALRSLKEAEFEDVKLVYKCLELLGEDYCKMRAGSLTRNQFDEKCQVLGVTESGCIADNRAGELGDIYFIPDYHGHKVKIDRHLKNGNSATRDPKRCMRIYFFWDDDMQQVVICYLPQHQQIRTS